MSLDEAYENKDKLALAVSASLQEGMLQYGVIIKKVLITDLQPDRKVLFSF